MNVSSSVEVELRSDRYNDSNRFIRAHRQQQQQQQQQQSQTIATNEAAIPDNIRSRVAKSRTAVRRLVKATIPYRTGSNGGRESPYEAELTRTTQQLACRLPAPRAIVGGCSLYEDTDDASRSRHSNADWRRVHPRAQCTRYKRRRRCSSSSLRLKSMSTRMKHVIQPYEKHGARSVDVPAAVAAADFKRSVD